MNGRLKGLALLDPAIGDAELLKLKEGGFTGFASNPTAEAGCHLTKPGAWSTHARGLQLACRVHVAITAEVIGAVSFLSGLKIPYVFDHVAHAEPQQNAADRGLNELLGIIKNEAHAWINLYSFYQLSKAAHPITPTWLMSSGQSSKHGQIMSSGSKRPHGGVRVPMPNDGDLLIFCSRRRRMTKHANISSWTIQPDFTAGPPTGSEAKISLQIVFQSV